MGARIHTRSAGNEHGIAFIAIDPCRVRRRTDNVIGTGQTAHRSAITLFCPASGWLGPPAKNVTSCLIARLDPPGLRPPPLPSR